MKIAGIVCEFNPFHNGHKYMIEKIKDEFNPDLLVIAMSPNFVMRGEPAIFNKFDRTKIAIDNGVDLVLEIPTIYTIESADIYAYRSVEILNNIGVTDLFFGSEIDDLETLAKVSQIYDDTDYQKRLKEYQDKGNSFKQSSKKAILDIYPEYDELLELPNVLLSIQYLRIIKGLNSKITPHVVKRIGANYYDPIMKNTIYQSASAIRESIENNTFKDSYVSYDCKKLKKVVKNDYFNYIKYKIFSSSVHNLKEIQGVNEGFENNLKSIKDFDTYDDLLNALTSKRNGITKVKRILMCLLLDIKKDEISNEPLTYIRVLGFNNKGQNYLKLQKDNPIHIYTSITKNQENEVYRELDFTKIYSLLSNDDILELEYKPIYKK